MNRVHHHVRRVIWTLALSILFLMTSRARAASEMPHCHILSIGVEDYKVNPLRGCAMDARLIVDRFVGQKGKIFGAVNHTLLINKQASGAAIERELKIFASRGKNRDIYVLSLSGHNSRVGTEWGFLAQDGKHVSGKKIAHLVDTLAAQNKLVIVIMDNCFSGTLRLLAQDSLVRHADPTKGGVILMVGSSPAQTSHTILNQYSVLSKSVDEGLSGAADYNRDGAVTLQELRRYVYARAHNMLQSPRTLSVANFKQARVQDPAIDWSLSVSESMVLARVKRPNSVVVDVRGSLNSSSARDRVRKGSFVKVHEVAMQKGVTYVIEMKSMMVDSYLRIENQAGTQLEANDDGGEYRDSRIVFTPTESGTYRICTTTYGSEEGTFHLSVRRK